jgi:hypothetical protein
MKLVKVDQIQEAFPDLNWPYKPDGTRRLMKLGRLDRVQVGRNVYVTRELLEQFIARHTVKAA